MFVSVTVCQKVWREEHAGCASGSHSFNYQWFQTDAFLFEGGGGGVVVDVSLVVVVSLRVTHAHSSSITVELMAC